MDLAIIAALTLVVVMLICLFSFRPRHETISRQELERRVEAGDVKAKQSLERELILTDLLNFRLIAVAVLGIALTSLLTVLIGQLLSIVVAILLVMLCSIVAKLAFTERLFNSAHNRLEKIAILFKKRSPNLFWLFSGSGEDNAISHKIGSRQELQFIIDNSNEILSDEEKRQIIGGLEFRHHRVADIMVPKDRIVSIKKTEFLGPLTLSELHKTGHSRLLVISGDLNHVVGVLYLKSLLDLDIKKSTTAEKAMEQKVYFIHQKRDLSQALATFIKTHQDLLVVINDRRETVGLLTVDDVIVALLGYKLNDTFEDHENIHAVAKSAKD